MDSLLSSVTFQAVCLLVIIIGCVIGVLSHLYDDTFLQRAALAVVAMGAGVELSVVLATRDTRPDLGMLFGGIALYAAATVIKVRARWRAAGRPGHPFRRSTDWPPLQPDDSA